MTALRHRRREDLPRRGLAPRTPPCSSEAVTPLSRHYRRAPDQITAEESRQAFLALLTEPQGAERPVRLPLEGLRLVSEITRQRPWPVRTRIRPRHRRNLPVVLRPQDVRSLVALVVHATAGMCLRMISAWGWRLREGTQLQVSAIAPHRLLVRVRPGQGGNDRVGPLAARPRELWRGSWPRTRPRPWVFPARDQRMPRPAPTLPQTCTRVVGQRGLATEAPLHPPRHAYATPLVERGISWRGIPALLGHTSPRTTARHARISRATPSTSCLPPSLP